MKIDYLIYEIIGLVGAIIMALWMVVDILNKPESRPEFLIFGVCMMIYSEIKKTNTKLNI